MPTAWIEHIKKWSKENGMSYMCAVGNPQCRAAYTPVKKMTQAEAISLVEYSRDYNKLEGIRDEVISHINEQASKRRLGYGGAGASGPAIRNATRDRYYSMLEEFRKNYPNQPEPPSIADRQKETKAYLKKSQKESDKREAEETKRMAERQASNPTRELQVKRKRIKIVL